MAVKSDLAAAGLGSQWVSGVFFSRHKWESLDLWRDTEFYLFILVIFTVISLHKWLRKQPNKS